MTGPTAGTVHVTLATFPAHATERPYTASLAPEQPPGAHPDAAGAPTAPQAPTRHNRKDQP